MGARILLIEDNLENLELMTYLLTAFGYTPLVAGNGVEGLDLARRERPDLIVCDIQMPKMNGYQVALELQRDPTLAGVPRVAVTALAMVGDRDRILAAGFNGYIAKPIAPEEFIPQLERYLAPAALVSIAKPDPPSAVPAAVDKWNSGSLILVVDDSPANLLLASSVLDASGYQVVTATNGVEALHAARRNRPALVLCDVHMRGGNGYACIGAFKSDAALRDIPFVFISSAIVVEDVRKKCLKLGAERFLSRPVESEELVAEIAGLLGDSKERGMHGHGSGG